MRELKKKVGSRARRVAECGEEQEAIVYFSRDTARLCSRGQGPLTCLCNFSFQQRHNYNKKRGVRVELRQGAVGMVGGGHDETANIGSFVSSPRLLTVRMSHPFTRAPTA